MVFVKLVPENKIVEVKASRVKELFVELGLSSEAYIVLVNGKPVVETYRFNEGDEVVVVRVLSGG